MAGANDVTVLWLADSSPRTDPSRRLNELVKRTVSALVAAPVAIAAVWFGSPWFEFLVGAMLVVGAFEWTRLCGLGLRTGALPVWGTPLVIVLMSAFAEPAMALPVLLLGVAIGMLQGTRTNEQGSSFGWTGRWSAGGVALLGTAGLAVMYLRIWVPDGAATILWLFAVVWASDIGAYFAGRTLGGPKLAPAISPGKTWSGLAGGLFVAMVVGGIGGYLKADAISSAAIVVAFAVAGAAAAGDLLESFVKRRFGAKDSGSIMPGHGGVLDRIDGVLTAAPVLAIIAVLSAGNPITWQ